MKFRCGSITIESTNDNKILFPTSKITKLDILNYYQAIAPLMLPFVKNRPMTMVRYPNGITGEHFFQKNAGNYFPPWIDVIPIEKESGEVVNYVNCANKATLLYIANQGCLTPHTWLSKLPELNNPDKMIFDLDPAEETPFSALRKTALLFKQLLDDNNLTSFVMTTGSRGLHIVVPIKPTHLFDEVRATARNLAQQLVDAEPNKLTINVRKDQRGNKIFIDYLRNSWGATSVAPFAVRAIETAPVATPLYWDAVHDRALTAQRYTISNVVDYLAANKNPWQLFNKTKNRLIV